MGLTQWHNKMSDNFGDLDTAMKDTADIDEDVLAKKIAYDKIFLDCYKSKAGRRMIDALRERLVDVAIYEQGATLEATSYRQGKADVVKMIDACVDDALNYPQGRTN